MSTGIVICSICKRELHQNGDKTVQNGWRHCEDKTPMCERGEAVYPISKENIKGKWCGRDEF